MKKPLPRIWILATGGTISYRAVDVKQEGDFDQVRFSIDQLLPQMPEVEQAACLQAEQLFQIGSTSITDGHWLTLARRVQELLDRPEEFLEKAADIFPNTVIGFDGMRKTLLFEE